MSSVNKISRVFTFCFAILLVCSRLASAGVPSPVPDAAVGPEVQIANLGDFKFESGEVVKDFKVSYVTHGKLNENRDNVILAMHYLAGNHHSLDFLIGPGRALDTNKYFIVATDELGNSHPGQDVTTGATNSGLKMDFPQYTFRDSVNVEYKLLKEHFGFDRILAAVGISVGAMKTYQFGVSYPNYVRGLIPIAGTPVSNPQTKTLLRSFMEIFKLDTGWYGGWYETNPTTIYYAVLWNLLPWCYTPQWFATNIKTEEAYRQWRKMWRHIIYNRVRGARDIYYALGAWVDHNVGSTPGFNGDAKAAVESIQAQVLIIGAKGDMLFRRDESVFAQSAIQKCKYIEIDSLWGHFFPLGLDPGDRKIMDREITKFLSCLVAPAQ